jgi:hypothetical protein
MKDQEIKIIIINISYIISKKKSNNQKNEYKIWQIKNFNKKMIRQKQIIIIKMKTKVNIKIKF